jgi:hypothetical protein
MAGALKLNLNINSVCISNSLLICKSLCLGVVDFSMPFGRKCANNPQGFLGLGVLLEVDDYLVP